MRAVLRTSMSFREPKMRTGCNYERLRYTVNFLNAALLFITQTPVEVKDRGIRLDGFKREFLVSFVDVLNRLRRSIMSITAIGRHSR